MLVLSPKGSVDIQAMGDFTGDIAGEANVQLQPGNHLAWIDWRDKPMDFPTGEDDGESQNVDALDISQFGIVSWQIETGN